MHIKIVSDKKQIRLIESLANEIWYEHYIPIIGVDQVEYMLKKFQSFKAISQQIKDGSLYFLCEHENEPIGYMSVIIREKELFLNKFYVKATQRNKGFGREMMVFLEALSETKGLSKISLTVNINNTESIKAYEALGFVKCGTVIQDIGNGFFMDDHMMEKKL